ncbi:patatin-like phospholipase family protein [Aliagarivorans taiwanensis]|uniref:patatin-like phospholipase family protein n=1 Tax=Aliagarivorans taiwanensis TaxID=561966 RepID=UPI000407D90B|nr:patatin-like phospholipase family protein [Aliagarivorans taiwanensis]
MAYRALLVIVLGFYSSLSLAERPTVGLALGGGGAKGGAHLGVMQLLEEYQIPVDYVAGTSMGAYFGGMMALGLSSEEIARRTYQLDWNSGFVDDVGRGESALRNKQQADTYTIELPFGVSSEGVRLPKGAVQGQTMAGVLRKAVGNLDALTSFDQLAIPYRAIATDIEYMQEVVLDHGELSRAMHASMSVPGALRPIEWEGKLLSDGGVVNNLPIGVLKEMGADIVIAVDIGAQLKPKSELDSAVAVVDQLSIFLTRSGTQRQIAMLEGHDLLIVPDISDIGTSEFAAMPLAQQRGIEAAREPLAELAKLFEDFDYESHQQEIAARRRQLNEQELIYISKIAIDNQSSYSDAVLLERLGLEEGEYHSIAELEEQVKELYALRRFERVDYQVTQQDGENVLQLQATEKSWGPGFFALHFSIQENFEDRTDGNMGLAFTLTQLNPLGAEWRNELEVGTHKRVFTEFYTPLDNALRYSWALGFEYNDVERRVFGIDDELEYLNTRFKTYNVFSELAYHYRPWQAWSLGAAWEAGEITALGFNLKSDYELYGPYLRFDYDTLDSISFPTQGKMLSVEWRYNTEDVSGFSPNRVPTLDGEWQLPFSYLQNTLTWYGEFGGSDSDFLVPTNAQDLGGFLRLSGYRKDQLSGRYKAMSGLMYYYRWREFGSGITTPFYLGGSLERGGVWNELSDLSWGTSQFAASIFAGLETNLLGPIILSYGHNEEESSLYLFIGNDF